MQAGVLPAYFPTSVKVSKTANGNSYSSAVTTIYTQSCFLEREALVFLGLGAFLVSLNVQEFHFVSDYFRNITL